MKDRLTKRARSLRNRQTDAEAKLWARLRNRQINGWKFKRQVPRGNYIVDFFCAEAGLVIEADGSQHLEEQATHDQERTRYLEEQGYRILRFWNRDILTNMEGTLGAIYKALGDRPAPTPGTSRGRKSSSV